MSQLPATIIAGISVGLLYGLLGFSIVVLYKATGLANFAQGNMATFSAFMVYLIHVREHLGLPLSILLSGVASLVFGAFLYLVAIRPNETKVSILNLTTRTLAIYLLLAAVMTYFWGIGQPFDFPQLVPNSTVHLGANGVSANTLLTLGTSVSLVGVLWYLYQRTNTGVLFRALADRPAVAALLGVRVRRLTLVAWVVSAGVSFVVGVVTAPSALLSTGMMDLFLVYALAGAIIGGGLASLPGAFVGGLLVGVTQDVVATLTNGDIAILVVFVLLVAVLLVRPHGLLARAKVTRV